MKIILPHDPRWRTMFTTEAHLLQAELGQTALRIEHIGSTAVPGIFAKPIIDVALEASSLDELDARVPAMENLGYEARGEHGIPGRRYFKKPRGPNGVGFHVHCFASGSEEIERHVRFRDFLLAEPGVAREYSDLKQSLASPEGVLVADYVERKAEFVRRVQKLAHLRSGG